MNINVIHLVFAAIVVLLSSHFVAAGKDKNPKINEIKNVAKSPEIFRSRRSAISSYTFAREDIPGTDLKSGTFYFLRMKRFPSAYVTWATKKHASGYNYVFVDNVEAHRPKYEKGGEWRKDIQWAFLSTSEPGWYHLINRAVSCQYATWSNQETVDSDGTFFLTVDPNYPGNHAEDDFLFKPYQPMNEALEKPLYQFKLKSMPNAVVAWNAGNSSNDAFYIHVESTDDPVWLKRYSWGHVWYDDTLFSFEEVNDKEEDERIVGDAGENQIGQQVGHFATLVGKVGYDYNVTSRINSSQFLLFLLGVIAWGTFYASSFIIT